MISVEMPQTHQVALVVFRAFNIEYFLANEENLMKVGWKLFFVTAWLNTFLLDVRCFSEIGGSFPHYLWEKHSKTPSGCLKLQIASNLYMLFFFSYPCIPMLIHRLGTVID